MNCLQNVFFFFPIQTKLVETDFLVTVPIPAEKRTRRNLCGKSKEIAPQEKCNNFPNNY